jgi:hypothetical protein
MFGFYKMQQALATGKPGNLRSITDLAQQARNVLVACPVGQNPLYNRWHSAQHNNPKDSTIGTFVGAAQEACQRGSSAPYGSIGEVLPRVMSFRPLVQGDFYPDN